MGNQNHPQGFTRMNGWKDQHGNVSYSLRLPARVGHKVAHLKGALFSCELTEEGILFRLIAEPADPDGTVPEWAEHA